ncbi:hypothetical protein TRVL_00704 [Trypanosoma vivax]|nr:hypothetical protein TRVL_00704 [Trypanosoma vivax]
MLNHPTNKPLNVGTDLIKMVREQSQVNRWTPHGAIRGSNFTITLRVMSFSLPTCSLAGCTEIGTHVRLETRKVLACVYVLQPFQEEGKLTEQDTRTEHSSPESGKERPRENLL